MSQVPGMQLRTLVALRGASAHASSTMSPLSLLRLCASRQRPMLMLSAARTMADHSPRPWNYLWKPGPYPRTKEAREAAARKYGMIPEDYEPFPDDGEGVGDYPNLKPSSGDSRSGLVDWDIPEYKRNFGEPLRYNYEMTWETRFDDTSRMVVSDAEAWAFFIGIMSFFIGVHLIARQYPAFPPAAEEQLPYKEQGKVRKFYHFELEKEQ